jgi:hypothetical protein
VVQQVEEAVLNLVTLAGEKLASRNSSSSASSLSSGPLKSAPPVPEYRQEFRVGDRKSSYSVSGLELAGRSSLPDIPLTPRERQILEQTSQSVMERHNHYPQGYSQDSVLLDEPPPKPPLPAGRPWCLSEGGGDSPEPPPLPPKRRPRQSDGLNPLGSMGLEVLSLRSKSPEDTSSLLSASAGSLDSVLNHSRDEEELRVLMDPDSVLDGDSITLTPAQGVSPGRSPRLSPGATAGAWLACGLGAAGAAAASAGGKGAVNGSASTSPSPSPCCCWDGSDGVDPQTQGQGQVQTVLSTQHRHLSASLAESGFHSMRGAVQSYSASSHHR